MNPLKERIIAVLLFIATGLATALVVLTPAPAQAGGCTFGVVCGQIHHGNDTGYDPAILIRCDYGVPSTNHLLYETRSSTRFCRDTDQVYVRAGEELWCKYYRSTSTGAQTPYWKITFDATGWHQIHNDFNRSCTLRKD